MAYIYKRDKYYRIQYRDASGKIRDCRGFSALSATKIEASRIEDQVIAVRRGIISPEELKRAAAEKRTITEHLSDFGAYITSLGRNAEYVNLRVKRIARVFQWCGVEFISQVDNDTIQVMLSKMIKNGAAPRTAAHYAVAIRQFATWLFDNDRTDRNILKRLKTPEVTEIRHDRTAFTPAEIGTLIAHVEQQTGFQQGGNFKLRGVDRAMLYRIAIATGLRRRSLQSLTAESFHLVDGEATVCVAASHSKNKKAIVIPLSDDLAGRLRRYLEKKSQSRRLVQNKQLWPIPECSSRMLMADFKKAGVVFPQDGKARDFHSLRHSAISAWVIAGDLRTAQELAGHSTPVLTARYSHPQQSQLRTVINAANAIAPPATP